MDYFINENITYYLLQSLSFKTMIELLQINSYFYGIIVSTSLFGEIVVLKRHRSKNKNLLIDCYQLGLLRILKSLHASRYKCGYKLALQDAIINGQIDILNWLTEIGCYFDCISNLFMLNVNSDHSMITFTLPRQISYALNNIRWETAKNILATLHWFKNKGYSFENTRNLVDWASSTGQITILDYLEGNDYLLDYENAVNLAAENNQLKVLHWFKNHHYDLNCGIIEIDRHAAKEGHLELLHWFKNNGYRSRCKCSIVISAANNRQLKVLDWLKCSGYKFKYSHYEVDNAASKGHLDVLDWFDKSGLLFKYTHWAIDKAAENNHLKVLHWFKSSSHPFTYTDCAIDGAAKNGHLAVLDWFEQSGYPLKYTHRAVDWAAGNGYVAVLDWFWKSNHSFKHSVIALHCARKNKHEHVIEWFKMHYFDEK